MDERNLPGRPIEGRADYTASGAERGGEPGPLGAGRRG